MFKKMLIAGLVATAFGAQAQTAGSLAFTSYNTNEDGFSLVTFVTLAANTTIYFSDNEYDGTSFNSGESYSQWNTGAAPIAAGTVIRFSAVDSSTNLASSVGTFSRATVSGSANWGLSTSSDTVYAYLGSSATAPTTFLTAVSSETNLATFSGQLTNTGLSVGNGAVYLGSGALYREYTGARSGQTTFAGYNALVNNASNWSASVSNATAIPNTSAFAVTPIPEPASMALMLAGLGFVGAAASRRRRG